MSKRDNNLHGPEDARPAKARQEAGLAPQESVRLDRRALLAGARHVTSDEEPPGIMTSEEVSDYLWQRYRLQRSPRRLGQLRAGPAGSGPEFHRDGNIPLYKKAAVDRWAQEQLGRSFANTTAEEAYYAQRKNETVAA